MNPYNENRRFQKQKHQKSTLGRIEYRNAHETMHVMGFIKTFPDAFTVRTDLSRSSVLDISQIEKHK